MNLRVNVENKGRGRRGFTLTEVLVSLAVSGFLFVSLYAGLAQGTTSLKSAREKLRATQILTEKLEVIRLYNWDQVNTPGYIPATFTDYQYPSLDTNNPAAQGIAYNGTITIGPAEVHSKYTNTMRNVSITLRWANGASTNQETMATLISEFGVQRYVY